MSLITPITQNTTIQLYSNIGWDNSNRDVRLFESAAERINYLEARRIENGIFYKCSIVSPGKSIKLEGNFNKMFTATYMSFANVDIYSNARQFYAFVTGVNYVNAVTVEIEYEIDWIQTYLFDFKFEASLVEREHVNNDAVGRYTLEENLDYGEYTIVGVNTKIFSPMILVQVFGDTTDVKLAGGVASCIDTIGYNNSNLGGLTDFLSHFNEAPERVVSIQMGVSNFLESTGWVQGFTDYVTITKKTSFSFKNDSYTPRNNKLQCYPYMLLTADNYMGQVEQFRWELGGLESTTAMDFKVWGTPVPKPVLMLSPMDYYGNKGVGTGEAETSQKAIIYDNFPQCPWITDTYRAWVSQYGAAKAVSAGAEVVGNIVAMGMAASAGNYMAAGMLAGQAVRNVTDTALEARNHQIHSYQLQGTVGAAGLQYMKDEVGFRFTQYAIRPDYARRLDKFFDRYGYKVEEVKVPNIRGRKNVNYVKTMGGKVTGPVPADAKVILENAMDAGISFWHIDAMGEDMASNPIV